MKAFFLKLLPYLISILAGAIIYVVAELHIDPEIGIYSLIIGIASGLLSIPLIFICYEGINRICSQNLRKTLFHHLSFEINAIIIDILKQLKTVVQFTEPLDNDNLERLLDFTADDIRPRIYLDAHSAEQLQKAKEQMFHVVQKEAQGQADILSDQEMENLLFIRKECGSVAREINHLLSQSENDRDFHHLASSIALLTQHISEWLDQCETQALVNHEHYRFLS